ncbi:MAG: hypothetical protein II943_03005 [Victivallales bacterium]|nr:hypothetical protein [Victivallales bacterium]
MFAVLQFLPFDSDLPNTYIVKVAFSSLLSGKNGNVGKPGRLSRETRETHERELPTPSPAPAGGRNGRRECRRMESPLSRAVLRDGLALHFMSLG